MSDSPRVSVVMCSYNGIGLIERAVASIRAQTYSNWELLISDDGSTDGTRDYLAALDDPRIRILLQPRNLGYVANKNAAIHATDGDLITQQDQDDVSDPARLALQVEAMTRSGVAIVACGYRRIDVDGVPTSQSRPDREIVINHYDDTGYPFWYPSLLVRRCVYEEIGYFEPFFADAFGDDLYWTVRANERFPILCLPDILYDYRDTPGSITSRAGSDRKLVMGEILEALFDQRRTRGSDDLEDGNQEALATLESSFLRNRKLLAAKLRILAARAIDQRRFDAAMPLLKRSWRLDPTSMATMRTAFYLMRRKLAG